MSNLFVQRNVRLSLKPDITSEQVSKTLAEIYRLSGCLACGIRGIDVVLHGGDPEIDVLGKLGGIAGVEVRGF